MINHSEKGLGRDVIALNDPKNVNQILKILEGLDPDTDRAEDAVKAIEKAFPQSTCSTRSLTRFVGVTLNHE